MKTILLMAALCGVPSFAASMIGVEPPSNLIVSRGGLEWVWAAPCAPDGCGTITLHHGFAIPTAPDFLASFTSNTDIYNAFNAPTELCSSPYFSNEWNHCDASDMPSGYIYLSPFSLSEYAHSEFAETLLVRGAAGAAAAPEPGTVAMVIAGLAGLAIRRRR